MTFSIEQALEAFFNNSGGGGVWYGGQEQADRYRKSNWRDRNWFILSDHQPGNPGSRHLDGNNSGGWQRCR